MSDNNKSSRPGVSRRHFIKGAAAVLAAPAILKHTRSYAANPVIKIGYVSPQTGPLAGFGEADNFMLDIVRKAFAGGIKAANGKTYQIEIIAKDSQSNPNRAAEVAAELILKDKVDIMTASSTPDTVNPVSDQAELNEIPCVTSDCPWQPYFFGRGGKPGEGFEWTYHFFWGLEDVIATFLNLWDGSGVGKTVAGIFPNDADGNAWGDKELGLPKPLAAAGYTLVDPGRYQPLTQDFSAQISAFKEAGCEILTGNMIPPDFANFWSQSAQQGFNPKVVTVGKALLFPAVINSLGDRGDGLTTEIWWSPNHPYTSSLNGFSCKTMADTFTKTTGRPWTQPIGFHHAIFEVVADIIKRTAEMDDSRAILDSITKTSMDTIVGNIDWSKGPMNNVCKTPLVSGQWQKKDGKFDLVITNNETAPEIPVTGKLKLLS